MKQNCLSVLMVLVATCFWAAPVVAQTYTFTTPNVPGVGNVVSVLGMSGNNIVGLSSSYSFFYDGSTVTILNDPLAGLNDTYVHGLSGNYVVGNYTTGNQSYGFIYNASSQTYATLNDPLGNNQTLAIGTDGNNVVGWYEDTSSNVHGFVYNISSSAYTTLADPAGNLTVPQAISGNNIVGYYENPSLQGFLYNMSTNTYTTLNPVPYVGTYMTGISGDALAGTYNSGGIWHSFLYNDSTSTWTVPLDDPLQGTQTTSGRQGTQIQGISGNTIFGYYVDSSNAEHGFIATTVPEPSTFVLLTVGAVALVGYRWRRRAKYAS